jgi:hypothetical protein
MRMKVVVARRPGRIKVHTLDLRTTDLTAGITERYA